ncbi:hypothetical protein M9H77_11588 [Catharanthus roseus]|uniref:Uncharacterized protein n=1 Tax=Catharanthus roseus TaxID=4058 RepID=A0ACC0BEY7_CATRO|nr:hypothetical protein M9H77_11588 [Catharanthus roseus]
MRMRSTAGFSRFEKYIRIRTIGYLTICNGFLEGFGFRIGSELEMRDALNLVGLHGQSPYPQNEAIGTKFWHIVVNINQTPYERSITNNRNPYITGQNKLQTPGHLPGLPWGQPQFRAPPDSPLGDRPIAEHDAMST